MSGISEIYRFILALSKCFSYDKNPFLPKFQSRDIKQSNAQKHFYKEQDIKRKFIRYQRTQSK